MWGWREIEQRTIFSTVGVWSPCECTVANTVPPLCRTGQAPKCDVRVGTDMVLGSRTVIDMPAECIVLVYLELWNRIVSVSVNHE